MSDVTIVIPMMPPQETSPNARAHWREKARAVATFREAAGWATLAVANSQRGMMTGYPLAHCLHGVVMDVEIAWCCRRRTLDDDNAWASLKGARDGIADVLFGGDDRFMTQGELRQTRGEGTVTVRLREAAHE